MPRYNNYCMGTQVCNINNKHDYSLQCTVGGGGGRKVRHQILLLTSHCLDNNAGFGSDESVDSTISVDMSSSAIKPLLLKHWKKDECTEKSNTEDEIFAGGFMDAIESQLCQYINFRSVQY